MQRNRLKMWLEGLYCENLSMSARELRNMSEGVCVCVRAECLCDCAKG